VTTTLLRHAVKELTDLSSAREVAEFIATSGVQGRRQSDVECPVAGYLSIRTGYAVSVGRTNVHPNAHSVNIEGTVLQEMIENFDHGSYHKLTRH
jgi:hypothetical protein